MSYHRILTTVKNLEKNQNTVKAARDLAAQTGADVIIVYPLKKPVNFGFSYSLPAFSDMEDRHLKVAARKLKHMAKRAGFSDEPVVEFSKAKALVIKTVKKADADLVIMSKKKMARTLLLSPPCDMLVLVDG